MTGLPVPDLLGFSGGELTKFNNIKRPSVEKALERAEEAGRALDALQPAAGEPEAILNEWRLCARLAAHACRRVLLLNHNQGDARAMRREITKLSETLERQWMARNRQSDWADNRVELRRVADGYLAKNQKKLVL